MTSGADQPVPLWKALIFPALAGAMAWGIRGQYGHETGAMMAGLLVGTVLLLLFRPEGDSLSAARAIAWCTIAIGIGGSMTYGQTVGYTHDPDLVGRWPALWWGMLGLAIKGGIWAGFAGLFLGMALSGIRYRALELLAVWLGVLGLCALGIWVLNEPYDLANRLLPRVYFSDSWLWEPGKELKPRREVWGGLLFAFASLAAYTKWARTDPLAWRLALCAFAAGAIGFPLGQSVQAWHAWNTELFASSPWSRLEPLINWWNFMETIFGSVIGAGLGLGLWLNRARIAALETAAPVSLSPTVEALLLAAHLSLLVMVEFFAFGWVDALYDFGLLLGFIPIIAVAGGRLWPYLILPITVLPIAGKTLRQLVFREETLPTVPGVILYLMLPLAVAITAAVWFILRQRKAEPAARFLRPNLLIATWLFFLLNYAFFKFPWPWQTWTQRTPNALVFTVCALGLTWLALARTSVRPARKEPPVVALTEV